MSGTNGNIDLSHEEILRYSRHLIMPEVALSGQKKLKASSVLLIGTGGLGSPVGMYLAAAGIGRIGLVDYDVVDFTNLQRQVVHGTSALGNKVAVKYSNANNGNTVYAIGSTDNGNNTKWSFAAAAPTHTWTGATNGNWNLDANWGDGSAGSVPMAGSKNRW